MALVAAEQNKDPAEAIVLANSSEYYRALVEFAATASDELILAFNKMTKIGYDLSHSKKPVDREAAPSAFGDFMLAIRKELGPHNTKLSRNDMLQVRSPNW